METEVLETKPAMVPQSLVRGWSHAAVQRLRHALLHVGTDPAAYVEVELEHLLLHGAWFTAFLPVPFTAESVEGRMLSDALLHLRTRFQHRAMVQDFVFKFWDPARVDELELMFGAVEFDAAFQQSFTMSEPEVKTWPDAFY